MASELGKQNRKMVSKKRIEKYLANNLGNDSKSGQIARLAHVCPLVEVSSPRGVAARERKAPPGEVVARERVSFPRGNLLPMVLPRGIERPFMWEFHTSIVFRCGCGAGVVF